jgi:hypothetical protein
MMFCSSSLVIRIFIRKIDSISAVPSTLKMARHEEDPALTAYDVGTEESLKRAKDYADKRGALFWLMGQ